MKKYNDLFNRICTMKNFRIAYKNATKGKKHYTDVRRIEKYGRNNYLRELLSEVKNNRYKVSEYTIFKIYSGHKEREVYRLPMKDRIVQHAIMNYLEPIFRETFILDTYSSIKTRGIHLGLKRLKKALRNGDYNYYLKLDIHKCYPSLDKDVLKQKLSKKFTDPKLLNLLYIIIDSCEKGVPIGNYTSQYFNNFYFSSLDHWAKEVKRIKGYFRYCDDIVILAKTKEELHKLFIEIKEQIELLKVKLKENYQIYNIENKGIDFLGYITRKNYVKIRKFTKQNFINKVSKMDLNNCSDKDINVLGSYWGILKHGNCKNLWLKYTGVKTFKDLNIVIHNRDFVKNIIGTPIVITNSWVYQNRGKDVLKFECNYTLNDKVYNNVIIKTTAELLIEAAKQFNSSSFPFETTIVINDKGFYEFK